MRPIHASKSCFPPYTQHTCTLTCALLAQVEASSRQLALRQRTTRTHNPAPGPGREQEGGPGRPTLQEALNGSGGGSAGEVHSIPAPPLRPHQPSNLLGGSVGRARLRGVGSDPNLSARSNSPPEVLPAVHSLTPFAPQSQHLPFSEGHAMDSPAPCSSCGLAPMRPCRGHGHLRVSQGDGAAGTTDVPHAGAIGQLPLLEARQLSHEPPHGVDPYTALAEAHLKSRQPHILQHHHLQGAGQPGKVTQQHPHPSQAEAGPVQAGGTVVAPKRHPSLPPPPTLPGTAPLAHAPPSPALPLLTQSQLLAVEGCSGSMATHGDLPGSWPDHSTDLPRFKGFQVQRVRGSCTGLLLKQSVNRAVQCFLEQ